MLDIINIATTSDENYARGLTMMIASFIRSNKELKTKKVAFYILDGGLSKQTIDIISNFKNLKSLKWKLEINFIPADVSLFHNVPKFYGKTNITLARLFLGDLVKGDYTYWIDSDFIVNTLLPDYSVLEGKTIAGCVEPYLPELHQDFKEKEYPFGKRPSNRPYINAGFMLIDLGRWRKLGFSEKAIDAITKHPKYFTWLDQSAVNFFLADEITLIDPKYNRNKHAGELNEEISQNFTDSNLHLTGPVKPWAINSRREQYYVQNEIFLRMEEKLLGRDNSEAIRFITLKTIPNLTFKVCLYYFIKPKLYTRRKAVLQATRLYNKMRHNIISGIKHYSL